jgi:DNA-binding NarL/FixJ family response regulator
MSIRILIVDDSHVMRAGIRAALAKRPEFEVVGEASDGDEVPALVTTLRPDLVIMDVEMRRVGGIEAARRLSESSPASPRILMASLYADDYLIAEALRAGATGYVLKTCIHQDLAPAVRRLKNGGQFISRRVAALEGAAWQYHLPRIASELKRRLGSTERRMLELLAEGLSSADAARCLGLTTAAFEALSDATALRLSLDTREELLDFVKNGPAMVVSEG